MSDVLDLLREAGGRVTPQRRMVIEALLDTQPHPSADDVAGRIAVVAPEVHLSTVYRTLNTLTELGVVTHVHLGHGRSVYHFAHQDQAHLVCRVCGAVEHLDHDVFASAQQAIERATGFRVEQGHFAWSARCPACLDT